MLWRVGLDILCRVINTLKKPCLIQSTGQLGIYIYEEDFAWMLLERLSHMVYDDTHHWQPEWIKEIVNGRFDWQRVGCGVLTYRGNTLALLCGRLIGLDHGVGHLVLMTAPDNP